MKTISKVLSLGILMSALTAGSATSVFAQDACADVEAKQAIYKKFTDNYAGKLDQKKAAIEAGKEYVSKYGACPDDKQIVDYLNANLPKLEETVNAAEANNKTQKMYSDFDAALKAKNTANIFSTGKTILATDPNIVDVILVLASTGYDQSVANPPVDTYNNETINYAKSAIQKLEAGTPSKTGDYGVLQYSYKTPEFPEGKNNALGWMNYSIGYILYHRQNKKEEALPYLYKAAQANASTKSYPALYQTLGSYYRDQVARIGKEIVAKIDEGKKVEAITPQTDAEREQIKTIVAETDNLIGLQKGYADRAIDAYARAYKMTDAKNAEYKTGLYNSLKELYNLRYEGKRNDLDSFVASVTNTPLPDPTTKVTPVGVETTTASTTGDTNMTPTANTTTKPAMTPAANTKPAAPPAANTKPATAPATKPMSATDSKSTTKVTVTKTDSGKTAAKPAPKKKTSK